MKEFNMFYKIKHKVTKETQVVDELSDFLFEEGWRHEAEVPVSQVDIHEVDEFERLNSIRQYGF
jgi:hypothetical protein